MPDLSSWLPPPFRVKRPVVPLVRLAGPIGVGMTSRSGLSIETVEPVLERAFGMRGAVAVALAINSPGGSPAQSHLIFRRIRELAAEKRLPVIAYVEDIAASGGYMLACAADEIVADPSSILGSIGVVSAGFGFEKAIEKIGLERRVYTSGARKVTLDPFGPVNAEDVEHLKELQRTIHDMFIALVRERRGSKLTDDPDLFSGLFWAGARTLDLGLADRFGAAHADLVAKFGDKVVVRPVTRRKGFISRHFSASLSGGMPDALLSADELITSIERRALYSRYGM